MTRKMLSACRSVLAFTSICNTHTRTHKVLDVTLNCLGRVWPAVVILWMVARNAHVDIQLLCSLQVSHQWGEVQQVCVSVCHEHEQTSTQTAGHHWRDIHTIIMPFYITLPISCHFFIQLNLYIYCILLLVFVIFLFLVISVWLCVHVLSLY